MKRLLLNALKENIISRDLGVQQLIPLNVQWDLTYRCTNRCIHCYQQNCTVDKGQELPTNCILETLEQLKELGTIEVALSGGDPFLKEGFFEIIKKLHQLGIQYHILSSGAAVLTYDQLKILSNDCLSKIEVTLLGHNAELHDAITRKKGSFDCLVNFIQKLRSAGIRVETKTTLMTLNYKYKKEIENLCLRLGTDYRGIDTEILPPLVGNSKLMCSLQICDQDAIQIEKEKGVTPTPYIPYTRCDAGFYVIGIDPYGNVLPCLSFYDSFILGNLFNEDIFTIINTSETLKQFKDTNFAYDKCLSCGIQEFCSHCPATDFTRRNIDEPYDGNCRQAKIRSEAYKISQKGII